MLIRVFLILLAFAGFWIGIVILVRIFPELFSQKNMDTMRRVGSNVCVAPRGSISKGLVSTLAIPAATIGIAAIASSEQKKIINRKIELLESKIRLATGGKLAYFLSPVSLICDKIDNWKRQIACGDYDFSRIETEVIVFGNKLTDFWPILFEIENLFKDGFEVLEQIKKKNYEDPEVKEAIEKLEKSLNEYKGAMISYEDMGALLAFRDELKEINKFLKQILMLDNKIVGKKTYYEILGLARDATEEEIKKAYRKLALRYHTDRKAEQLKKIDDDDVRAKVEKEFNDMLVEINEAYSVLSDLDKRKEYDKRA